MSISERPQVLLESPAPVRLAAIVAIPVRNERDRIAACVEALAGQVGILPGSLGLLLFLNNCTDDTRDVVEVLARRCPWPIRILEEHHESASAGWARRQAMDAAAAWLESDGDGDGALLTTDADSRVGADWAARNLAALADGADAVAGRFAFEAAELAGLPRALRARQDLEATYEALLAEIDARLDPQPGNPWPAHWTRSGATIALRLAVYRRVGGVPPLASGEDHALIEAVRAHGFVVRYDPAIVVVTSGRLVGRARDGVADTLRLRGEIPETACDPRLERLDRAVLRILRRRARHAGGWPRRAERAYRPLRPSRLPRQIRWARRLLGLIRHPSFCRKSSRYASAREPRRLVAQPRAASRKCSAASSPVKG